MSIIYVDVATKQSVLLYQLKLWLATIKGSRCLLTSAGFFQIEAKPFIFTILLI